jgi:hypothetical protein
VRELEVLVSKLFAVYALAARTVEAREISSLDHEVFYDAVKDAASVTAQMLRRIPVTRVLGFK